MVIDSRAPAAAAAAAAAVAVATNTFSYLSGPKTPLVQQSQNNSDSKPEDRGSPVQTTSDVFAADYCKTLNSDLDKTKQVTHYNEEQFIQLLISKMNLLFASITYKLWEDMNETSNQKQSPTRRKPSP